MTNKTWKKWFIAVVIVFIAFQLFCWSGVGKDKITMEGYNNLFFGYWYVNLKIDYPNYELVQDNIGSKIVKITNMDGSYVILSFVSFYGEPLGLVSKTQRGL